MITTIGRNPYTAFPFDRFTLGEALSLSSVSFRSVLYFLVEGANERFADALYAF